MPARNPAPWQLKLNARHLGGHLWEDAIRHLCNPVNDFRISNFNLLDGGKLLVYTVSGVWQSFFDDQPRAFTTEKSYWHIICRDCGRGYCQTTQRSQEYQYVRCRHCQLALERKWNRRASRNYRIRNGLVHTSLFLECEHCAKRFQPQRSTARFCSTNCRVRAHRLRRNGSDNLTF